MEEIYQSSLHLSLFLVSEVSEWEVSLADGLVHAPYVTNVNRPVHMHVNQAVERGSKEVHAWSNGPIFVGSIEHKI